MKTRNVVVTGLLIAGLSALIIVGLVVWNKGPEELELVPVVSQGNEVDQNSYQVSGTEVGTGWSNDLDAVKATKDAFNMALEGKENAIPDFVIIYATSGSDIETIYATTREILGSETRIYGGTSDSRAVITEKKLVTAADRGYYAEEESKNGLGVMTVTSKDITFGVGSTDLNDYDSPQAAARAAAEQAILDAGKTNAELPQVMLVIPHVGYEEEILEGIEEVVSKKTIILGGTSGEGGTTVGVFGIDRVIEEGIGVAALYTDLPIGWTYEAGFDISEKSGVVTKMDGQAIVEIDDRPALEVYDEWLDGEITSLHEEGKDFSAVRDLLTLSPLYRKYTSAEGSVYRLYSHPWPIDENLVDKGIMTGTKIEEGERVYLSLGTWETLLNRIGNMPDRAHSRGELSPGSKPVFSLGVVCAGVFGIIPEDERAKIPLLINYDNADTPFIATIAWGEQGHFPGIGNKHGNLTTSFLIIGSPSE